MSNVLQFKQKPTSEQDSTAKGFALLHRKITDVPFYKTDSEAVHMWLHVILMANYAPKTVMTQLGEVVIGRGQFITGRTSLVTETGIKSDRVKYLLNKFVKLGMIQLESTKFFTKITVIKYDEYQLNSVPTECQQNANVNADAPKPSKDVVPAECHQSATTNEVLNISITNVIDCDSASADTPAQQEVTQQIKPARKKSYSIPYQAVLDAYNEIVGDKLPNAETLSEKRKRDIKKLFAEMKYPTLEAAKAYFSAFMEDAQPFHFGDNNRRWKANFDYVIRIDTLIKVKEGTL